MLLVITVTKPSFHPVQPSADKKEDVPKSLNKYSQLWTHVVQNTRQE